MIGMIVKLLILNEKFSFINSIHNAKNDWWAEIIIDLE